MYSLLKEQEFADIIIHPQIEIIMAAAALVFVYVFIITFILTLAYYLLVGVLKFIGYLLLTVVTALGFFLHWLIGKIYHGIFPRSDVGCRS